MLRVLQRLGYHHLLGLALDAEADRLSARAPDDDGGGTAVTGGSDGGTAEGEWASEGNSEDIIAEVRAAEMWQLGRWGDDGDLAGSVGGDAAYCPGWAGPLAAGGRGGVYETVRAAGSAGTFHCNVLAALRALQQRDRMACEAAVREARRSVVTDATGLESWR